MLRLFEENNTIFSDIHIYSHHLIESMLSVFGCKIRSVLAKRSGDSLAVISSYDGFNVLMNYGAHTPEYGREIISVPEEACRRFKRKG